MIVVVKNALRQAIEAASGGQCTVMFTKKGQPVFMRRFPKFRVETLDNQLGTGVHPAFIVGDREISEFWLGMYPAYLSQGELISVPGMAPGWLDYQEAIDAARAAGPGFHVVTNAEWAAMALLSIYGVGNGNDVVSGPDPYGRDRNNPKLFGVRADGKAPGDTSSVSGTITGSGPLTWRHDLSPWGVADVSVGFAPGYTTTGALFVNGEIRIVPNNDAALPNIDLSPSSPAWRAILPDGSLVAPGTSGTLKYDIPLNASYSDDNVAQNLGAPVLRTQVKTAPFDPQANQDYAYGDWNAVTTDPANLQVPPLLRQLGLFAASINRGTLFVTPYGARYAARGWSGLMSLYTRNMASGTSVPFIAYIV